MAPVVLPFVPLVFGLALGAVFLRGRTVTVTFQGDGRAFQVGEGQRRPIPATLTLRDAEWVRLRVVNRDTHDHALGVLSVEPGDSVEVRAEVCATTWRGRDLVVLVR
ncbi:MAG TPA: hypothetical protein VLV15_10195 [Dongiaceae bacterium]|nr:hypothetical protein [Dongiaceae bacterium]